MSKVEQILFYRIRTHSLQRLMSRLVSKVGQILFYRIGTHLLQIEEQIGQQSWTDFILQNWDSLPAEIEEQIDQ